MDRGWYIRLSTLGLITALAAIILWPTWERYGGKKAPGWVKSAFPGIIQRGLDIAGGLRLVYEVDVDEAVADLRERRADDLRDKIGRALDIIPEDSNATDPQLREVSARAPVRVRGDSRIEARIRDAADLGKITAQMLEDLGLQQVERSGTMLVAELKQDVVERFRTEAVQQAQTTIAKRTDELGIREIPVQVRDEDVIIELPGEQRSDFERVRSIISRTARLEFKIVAEEDAGFLATLEDVPDGITKGQGTLLAEGVGSRDKLLAYVKTVQQSGKVPEGRQLAIGRDDRTGDNVERWRTYLLQSRADVTGEDVEDAFVGMQQDSNKPSVNIRFTQPQGADKFAKLTERNVKKPMAIVLDDVVEQVAIIQSRIAGGSCEISYNAPRPIQEIQKDANDTVVVLKAGALPAPIRPSNEQHIGASLGDDAVKNSAYGAMLGILLTLIFMLLYYEVGGLVADVMVILNVFFLLGILAFFDATLTLPGIAGIALTVGMAVDANVLIMERIREELRAGKSPRAAVDQGYKRAFWSIMDSQLTTFIAGVVLYQYGTGPIRGFAVTLMAGILSSLFTGVFCSHIAMDYIVRGLRVQKLRVG